jgi:putative membrane protein
MKFPSITVGVIVIGSSMTWAQIEMTTPSGDTGRTQKTQLSTTDTSFIKTWAEGGMAEVDAGKLASEKGSDPGVKQFGEQMIKDHTKNNDELKMLAKSSGVALPSTLDSQHALEKKQLESENGASFDAAYVKRQVQDHQKTVQLLEHEIHSGQDPAVRHFAEETLPVVNHHLSMAKQLQAKLPNSVAQGSAQ